jgi:hypothetical protein
MLFCSLATILEFGTRKVQDFFATQKCTLRRSSLEKGLGFSASSKQAGMMMMMMVLRIVTASSKLRRKDQESFKDKDKDKDKDSEESQQSSRIFRIVRT